MAQTNILFDQGIYRKTWWRTTERVFFHFSSLLSWEWVNPELEISKLLHIIYLYYVVLSILNFFRCGFPWWWISKSGNFKIISVILYHPLSLYNNMYYLVFEFNYFSSCFLHPASLTHFFFTINHNHTSYFSQATLTFTWWNL